MNTSRRMLLVTAVTVAAIVNLSGAQRGSFNFAKKTAGERDGDLSPTAIAGVSIACVAGVAGLMVTIFFCYYVYKRQQQQDSFNNSFDPGRRI